MDRSLNTKTKHRINRSLNLECYSYTVTNVLALYLEIRTDTLKKQKKKPNSELLTILLYEKLLMKNEVDEDI